MKTIKHIITWECYRQCSYCINNQMKFIKKDRIANNYPTAYRIVAAMGFDALVLTGGEPTLNPQLEYMATEGHTHFDHVSIITANEKILTGAYAHVPLDDIMFSIHGRKPIPKVEIDMPVYAMIMVEEIYGSQANELLEAGYHGITVHEEYPNGRTYSQKMKSLGSHDPFLPSFANLSIRYKRAYDCVKGQLLTPNYQLIDSGDFKPGK